MAQKRFSRLSVLLEARDRMSRPMQNAARSAAGLNNSVRNLSTGFTRNRESAMQAATGQRILAHRYRELGNRLSITNAQLSTSQRIFRTLTGPIRNAAAYLSIYSRSLFEVVSKTTLVRITTKALSASFKTMSTVMWNLNYYLGQGIKRLWELSRAGKAIKFLTYPIRQASQGAKWLAHYIGSAAKNTFAWKASAAIIKMVAGDIKMAAIAQKTFIKDIPFLVRHSYTYALMSTKIQGVKRSLGAAYLAFNLWKNASPTVEKINRSMDKLKNSINKITDPIKRNIQNMRNLGTAAERTGTQGRATFNQLASSNARLNRELARMNTELMKANSRLGRMKSNLGSINGMGAAFGAAYAGQAAYGAGERFTGATVGKAMEQQYSSASVGILAGAENGPKFYKQIAEYAAQTTYSTEDWARNMRGAIAKSKSIEDLEQFQVVMEQLATLDPIQGLDGAALAIRELNSGDSISLQERFELPKGPLKEIRKMTDPIEQLQALSKMIGKETGYTVENLAAMKELPLMQWEKMKNSAKTMMGYIGAGALEKVAPLFEKFNQAWDNGAFTDFIATASAKLASFAQGLINVNTKIAGAFSSGSLAQSWAPFITLFGNVKNTLVEAWPAISEILGSMKTQLGNVATVVNESWPQINSVIQFALGLVRDFSNWIVQQWPTILPIIGGLVVAMGTLKIANAIAVGIGVLKTAIALWRNGTLLMTITQWALNSALLANPIGLVVALIAGLAAGLYIAYQKNETFRNAVQAAWTWIKDVGAAAISAGKSAIDGLVDGFKTATEWIGQAWEKFKGFASAVKNNPIGTLVDGAKAVAGWVGNKVSGSTGHHGGLNNVPYDGYNARLHKGERVLTAQENKAYNNGQGVGGGSVSVTGNTFIVRQDSDIDAIAEALFVKLNENKMAMGV